MILYWNQADTSVQPICHDKSVWPRSFQQPFVTHAKCTVLWTMLEGVHRGDAHHFIFSRCWKPESLPARTQRSQTFKWMHATDVTLSPCCTTSKNANSWGRNCFFKTFWSNSVLCSGHLVFRGWGWFLQLPHQFFQDNAWCWSGQLQVLSLLRSRL